MRTNLKTSTPKKQVTKERYGLFLFDYISSSRVVTGDSLAGAKFFLPPSFWSIFLHSAKKQKNSNAI